MKKFHFYKSLLYSFIVVLLSTGNMIAQCAITDLEVIISDCDANDKFSAEINFNFTEVGTAGFQILGNGNNYGTYQYSDLPVSIEGLNGNCEIEYEFIVRDVGDPTCADFLDYGVVCCDDDCMLSVLNFETSDCNENVAFDISLNLEYQFVGDNGFTATVNGDPYGTYNYEDLPIDIVDITSGEEGNNTLTICDVDSPDCCVSYIFLNPCVCGMNNITTQIVDCNSDDSTYFLVVNFDHETTNDSFQMGYSNAGDNTFLGVFAYTDLPVTAGPILLSENEQELLIVDQENFFCFNSAYLAVVDDCDIECQIHSVFAEAYMCEDGEYFMDVEFEVEDIEGLSFDILVDGDSFGTFQYGLNTYTIGPIPSDCETAPVVIVQDNITEGCFDFFNLTEPVCCLAPCNFTSFDVDTECSTTMLTVNGNFENNGQMLSGFYFVELQGISFGPFPYGNFMFSIDIPLLANGEYSISINDSLDPDCQISTTFISQCDNELCMIFEVFAEASECEEGMFFVDVEFEYGGTVSDSFEIFGNGMNHGTFAYGESFYSVGPLEGDCETIFEFVVSDQILEGCNSFYALEEPICCSEECSIRDISILEFSCLDEGNISGFLLDFIYEDTPSEMFTMIIDGENLGEYSYSELPLNFALDISNEFEMTIQDSENEDCQTSQGFELNCDDNCHITDLSLVVVDCSDEVGIYFLELNLEHDSEGDSVAIFIDETEPIIISYDEIPFEFGPFSLTEQYQIFINDSESPEYCGVNHPILVQICETSLDEALFSDINISQSSNSIRIENNEEEELSFQLYSTTGVLIDRLNVGISLAGSLGTSTLPQGLYLLNISNEKSQKTIKLFVY